VYLAESGRTTVATPRELDGISRYPILATVPLISLWNGPILEGPRDTGRNLPALPSTVDEVSASIPETLLEDSREGVKV